MIKKERKKRKTVQISVRVDKELLDWVDSMIENSYFFKDRTHAINMALDVLREALNSVTIIPVKGIGKIEGEEG